MPERMVPESRDYYYDDYYEDDYYDKRQADPQGVTAEAVSRPSPAPERQEPEQRLPPPRRQVAPERVVAPVAPPPVAAPTPEAVPAPVAPVAPVPRVPRAAPVARTAPVARPAPVVPAPVAPAPVVAPVARVAPDTPRGRSETRGSVEQPPAPRKVKHVVVEQSKKKKTSKKKTDRYDQYSSQESSSGFSLYSDKYRIIGAAKSKHSASTEPRANMDKAIRNDQRSLGAQMGMGQFSTPIGMVAGLDDTVVGPMPIKQEPLVRDSCAEDFFHTMLLPVPNPPRLEEQQEVKQEVEETNDIAVDTSKAGCGPLFRVEEEPDIETVLRQDWYSKKSKPLAEDSFVKDFVQTMWSCS